MNASVISALAALAGAAIGGLTSVFASLLTQKTQARAQWLSQDKLRRQELYKEFIEVASKCYVDALQHDNADIPALVGLYTQIGRIRVPIMELTPQYPSASISSDLEEIRPCRTPS
jgi:hypothetical protein